MRRQSTLEGFAVLSVAAMVSKVLSVVYLPFLTYILGKRGYGVYNSAYTVFTFIYVICNSGISVTISKMISELVVTKSYEDAEKTFRIARNVMIAVGAVMSVLMFIFAVPLAKLCESKNAYLALKFLAPTILITPVLSVYRGYFQGNRNMVPTAVSQVVEQIINVVLSLVFAKWFFRYGVVQGCAGGTIGTSVGALVSTIYLIIVKWRGKSSREKLKTKMFVKRLSSNEIIKKMAIYSIPMTVCLGLQNAGSLVDMVNIKSRLFAAGFNAVNVDILYGILGNYSTLITVPITIITALSAAILPALSAANKLGQKSIVENRINYSIRIGLLISIPSAIGLSFLSKPIYMFVFPRASEGYKLMMYGSITIILWSIVQIQATVLQSIGKFYVSTLNMVLGIVGKIAANYILVSIPKINIMGAVAGNILCFAIPLVLNYIVIKKSLKLRVDIGLNSVRFFMSSVAMSFTAGCVYYVLDKIMDNAINPYISNAVSVIIAILIGAAVYAYILVIMKEVTVRDLDYVPVKIRNVIPKQIISKIV